MGCLTKNRNPPISSITRTKRLGSQIASTPYNARETPHLYNINRDDLIGDYARSHPAGTRQPIPLAPTDSRSRDISPIGQPRTAITHATKAIQLNPDHHMATATVQ